MGNFIIKFSAIFPPSTALVLDHDCSDVNKGVRNKSVSRDNSSVVALKEVPELIIWINLVALTPPVLFDLSIEDEEEDEEVVVEGRDEEVEEEGTVVRDAEDIAFNWSICAWAACYRKKVQKI